MKKTTTLELISLEINQIEIDASLFNWFPKPIMEKDSNSIKKYGIQLPILVHKLSESKYILVDGFKRVMLFKSFIDYFSKENNNEKITSIVIPKEFNFCEVVKMRIETLSNSENNFPGYRVCSLLKMLKKNGFPRNEIVNNLMPRLGLKSSERLATQLIEMGSLLKKLEKEKHFRFSEFLKTLSCEDFIILRRFSEKDFLQVLSFVSKMEVSGNKLRHMLQIIDEISRMQETTVKKILNKKEFKVILTNNNLNLPVRYRLIKKELDYLRYPKLNDLRRIFAKKLKKLNLPYRISLDYDSSFEDDSFILNLEISSLNELRKHLKDLEDILSDKEGDYKKKLWEDLFSVI